MFRKSMCDGSLLRPSVRKRDWRLTVAHLFNIMRQDAEIIDIQIHSLLPFFFLLFPISFSPLHSTGLPLGLVKG